MSNQCDCCNKAEVCKYKDIFDQRRKENTYATSWKTDTGKEIQLILRTTQLDVLNCPIFNDKRVGKFRA